jgi:hypothetical protein
MTNIFFLIEPKKVTYSLEQFSVWKSETCHEIFPAKPDQIAHLFSINRRQIFRLFLRGLSVGHVKFKFLLTHRPIEEYLFRDRCEYSDAAFAMTNSCSTRLLKDHFWGGKVCNNDLQKICNYNFFRLKIRLSLWWS